jgi:hypothetical protein
MSRDLVSKANVLSISLGLVALAAMALPLTTRAAQPDEGAAITGNFTVEFEGVATCPSPDPSGASALPSMLKYPPCAPCVTAGGYYVEAQGSGYTSQGAMFIEVLKCYNPAGAGGLGNYEGFFQITAPNGPDSLMGTYSGQNYDYGPAGDALGFGPFSGTLTVTAGTGKFEGAKGSFNFTALSGPGSPGPTLNSIVGNAFYSVQGRLELRGEH